MPLAAILSATAPSSDRPDLPRAQIIFAAQTLIEYQARQALHAGATQLFVMVEAVTPQLSRMVDRVSGEGVEVHLVRDMAGLVRQLPRESDVLLFADGMIVDQKHVMELGLAQGNALLVVGDDALTAHLERVDSVHRWAGVARVAPATLFNTLDLIGDWDIVLTILRAVVQSDPRRIVMDQSEVGEGKLALIDRQETADVVGKSLSGTQLSGGEGAGFERYALGLPARLAATQLLRMQISSHSIVWGAAGLGALGLLGAALGWVIPAIMLFLIALLVEMTSRHLGAMGQHVSTAGLTGLAPAMVVSLGIAVLGIGSSAVSDGVYLGALCVLTVLVLNAKKAPSLPGWAFMTPGSAAAILMAGAIFQHFRGAMIAAVLLGIMSFGAMLLLNPERGGTRS